MTPADAARLAEIRDETSKLAADCLRAALSYERDARERPSDLDAPFWRSMAQTYRASAEILMGWPKGTAQLPARRGPE